MEVKKNIEKLHDTMDCACFHLHILRKIIQAFKNTLYKYLTKITNWSS